jgi:hypothetical protein
MPDTVADRIRKWADKEIRGASVMTRNTDAYNHMMDAVARLTAEPWTQTPVADATGKTSPAAGEGA